MENLTEKELIEFNGGSQATYDAFHAAGKAIHDAVVNACDAIADWWNS